MTNEKQLKKTKNYICNFCNFITTNKKDFNRHLITIKHINMSNNTYIKDSLSVFKNNKKETIDNEVDENGNNLLTLSRESTIYYYCDCGKYYPYRSSLYNHKKKCNYILNNNAFDDDEPHKELKDLVCKLITENNEIKNTLIKENANLKNELNYKNKQIDELIPRIGDNIINNNIHQNFNINIFLNEQCKDAVNMNEFIEDIQSSIFSIDFKNQDNLNDELNCLILDNINKLGIFKRPLHCTDIKKETLYIKDNNSWFKDENKNNIKKAIKNAASYQYKALYKWIHENTDIQYNENKKDYFVKSLSSLGKDNDKLNTKLIKSICNKTYLKDKDLIDE